MLTITQLEEWEAYDKIDPIGSWREDFRMAYLASTITNLTISVHGKQNAKMTAPSEFMPEWVGEEEPRIQSVEEMKEIVLGISKFINKKKIDNLTPPKRSVAKTKGL